MVSAFICTARCGKQGEKEFKQAARVRNLGKVVACACLLYIMMCPPCHHGIGGQANLQESGSKQICRSTWRLKQEGVLHILLVPTFILPSKPVCTLYQNMHKAGVVTQRMRGKQRQWFRFLSICFFCRASSKLLNPRRHH